MQVNFKDINNISYRIVKQGKIDLNGTFYAPQYGKPREGEKIKITSIPPSGVTLNGKKFILVDRNKYWFAVEE